MADESQDFTANTENMEPSDKGSVFDIQEHIVLLLGRAFRNVVSACVEEFATYGITPAQFIVLMHLEGFQSDSQVCLSKKTGIDRTTIAGIVDRLEKKGFVARTKVAEDRRIRRVVLTDYGLEVKKDLCIAAERVRSRLMDKISPLEYADLSRLLTRLRK